MTIKVLTPADLNADLQMQAEALFAQLTDTRQPIPLAQVLTPGSNTWILGCMQGGRLIGMASMAAYSVVSGRKGWIEDVVVDQSHRGKGLGRILVERLIELGKDRDLTDIFLFTGRARLPAIALYESLGFKQKDSHLYLLKLAGNESLK